MLELDSDWKFNTSYSQTGELFLKLSEPAVHRSGETFPDEGAVSSDSLRNNFPIGL
jgi:hypothetical protein